MNIDPGAITLIQATFLEHINVAFATMAGYAFKLLYLFASIELVILGLAWALQRDLGWDKLFFKIIKIGIIFFIIQNYPWLLSTILESFAQMAGIVVNDASIAQYVFNPAKIWQYGYNVGVHLLQLAANSNIFGLAMIQLSLGMGILLVFGLLGIQMVVQIVGFYVVSFGALILLPFGALSAGRNMLDKAVQSVLQAGLRLMVLIIIIGMAVLVWNSFDLTELSSTTNFNINQPLGLFFSALLFLSLAFYLPKVLSQIVGELSDNLLNSGGSAVSVTRESAPASISSSSSGMPNIQAATTISPSTSSGSNYTQAGISSASSAASMPTSSGAPISGNFGTKEALNQASTTLSKSFSENTVKKIKAAVAQAMKEKTENN
ncbi:MAG: type IV secretion system protein [Gammaproteobacteria bacterium]|nr:type IV secretion system protein [Gammaproteobacteria bacterium]